MLKSECVSITVREWILSDRQIILHKVQFLAAHNGS